MLKRLELIGFKSFADKTQFDFPAGITGIVGPNGSGKSNVVDAVRWILGEQSAKSLRGGEMADVIFNGSTSRRGFGMAEVTMTFDNTRRILTLAADEVQITRRVYRSGEGEYLINHQVCRLKDIKDLFLGSGAGADAYCIIEQGKVDVLLQASTRDRRTIFEEAAGISRFKARKIETIRKLERVDQNVERLRDIIAEVEKQLRSVKLQAAKAQRYQEYSNRLKELRVALGLDEYQQLTSRLDAETVALARLKADLDEQAALAERWEADARRLEETLARQEEVTRRQEASLADARLQIAAEETTLHHEWALSADLETDLATTRVRLTELSSRVATLAGAAAQAGAESREVEQQEHEQRQGTRALEEALQGMDFRLHELRQQIQEDKTNHLDLMHQAARLHNDAVSYQAQVDNLRRERDRLLHKTEQAAEHLACVDLELEELAQEDDRLQNRLTEARQALTDHRHERERVRQRRDDVTQKASDLRAQHSGLTSRIEILEGLEKSHEGLGAGVREVIALLNQPTESSSWIRAEVVGMVADFLTVRREYAALIDVALAGRAQQFVVRDAGGLVKALGQRAETFSSRVSFLPFPSHPPASTAPVAEDKPNLLIEILGWERPQAHVGADHLATDEGIVARADQLVVCENSELHDLPGHLLGKTLIVRDLEAALAIAANMAGYRFVTLRGELLEADGALAVGAHHAETGILSRKSELRESRVQVAGLDHLIATTEHDLAELREHLTSLDARGGTLQEEIDVLAEQAADLRSRLGQRRQRREGLHEEVTVSRREISAVERDIRGLDDALHLARTQAENADGQVRDLQIRLETADQDIRAQENLRQQQERQVTAAMVALAQVEERLIALRAKHARIQADWDQRRQERQHGEDHLAAARGRMDESQQMMLRASAALASCFLQKEIAERQTVELIHDRELTRQERQLLADRALEVRGEWRARQEEAHSHELEVNDLGHRRQTLADRLREDYQLELADLYQENMKVKGAEITNQPPEDGSKPLPRGNGFSGSPLGEEMETGSGRSPRTAGDLKDPPVPVPISSQAMTLHPTPFNEAQVNDEIAELRRKLNRLGGVNLDSLQELTDLETRAGSLQTQFDDLTAAKHSLEEIIATINQDSRRLFTDTFASIRTHFQELFRKLFGGGMADIVLEDENDILESGIEIVARPPGKELRGISLMSGGEKTLTAVALLLAIFRSKPSPFCILDEVDAALDEANIGRFTAVLREFLDQSQFIIITHSKRTMAVADVLYGITMQESGVSKRVAIRFEDWVENSPATTPAEPLAAVRNGQ